MFRNYIKIAWRNLIKFKTYAFINIGGLAVGLTGFILVLLYLNYELSYDTWDTSLERTYKISLRTNEDILETTPAPLSQFIREKLPYVEAATTMQSSGSFSVLISSGEKKIFQEGGVEADSCFLRVFPYTMIAGDARSVLNKPNAIIISETVAEKMFGKENAIGKPIKIFNAVECEVTGIFREPSSPSHIMAGFIYRSPYEKSNKHWQNFSYQTYIKTAAPMPLAKLEQAVDELYYNERLKENGLSYGAFKKAGNQSGLFAEKVGDIHNFPKYGTSNFKTVMVLLLLSVLLLVSGAINFSNLSVAASIRRAKEVGLRKVLGSSISQLRLQFLAEIALQCLFSFILSLILVALLLPYFNTAFNLNLVFAGNSNLPFILLQIAACLILVTVLSGLYPAFFLSKYNIIKVLKGDYTTGNKGAAFKNTLIVLQFAVATFFVCAVLIIYQQMQYMKNSDKGFNASQVMRLETSQKIREKLFDNTRNRLLAVPGVEYVSKTTNVPGDPYIDTSTNPFSFAGKPYKMSSVKVSADYFKTLDIVLQKGRLFDDRYADEHTRTAVINESAARMMQINNELPGEAIYFPGCDTVPVQIVGIVKDFNIAGFESKIQPAVFTMNNYACMFQSGGAVLVKLNGDNIGTSIAGVEAAWKTIDADMPIRYSFLDDNFRNLFASYYRLQKMLTLFSISAIVLSLLGLFALMAFLINRQMKEISIRKILGAGSIDISMLLSSGFFKLIVVAIAIAIPLAWLAAGKWLQTFSYRINMSLWTFILAACIILLLAMATISILIFKSIHTNPAKNLRAE